MTRQRNDKSPSPRITEVIHRFHATLTHERLDKSTRRYIAAQMRQRIYAPKFERVDALRPQRSENASNRASIVQRVDGAACYHPPSQRSTNTLG